MDRIEFKRHFEELYLPLCMFSLRLLNDNEEAEDAVQTAFASAWEKAGVQSVIVDLKPYLYRAVRNLCISKLREKGRTSYVELGALEDDVEEEEIDTSERDALLWSAIRELPERCREVFLMSKRDGMSNGEIADELGISLKTVENQMTKAYHRLRDALKPEGRKVFFLPFL